MAKARILILGGGFGGLFTALGLAGSADVTLVSDQNHFLFTPMLYEYLSGEVEEWHIAPRFNELLDNNVNIIHDKVTAVDINANQATLERFKDPLSYDVLVLAIGGVTNYVGVEGAEQHTIPFRKIADADNLRRRMVQTLDRIPPDLSPQDVRRELTFAVVGAGASGCELSTKMADLLLDAVKRRALHGEPRVLVIEMSDRVVPGMGDQIREFVEDALRESHVEVHTRTRVVNVAADSITFEHEGNREQLQTAGTVWTGGVKMRPLVEQLDVAKTSRGLIKVRPTLQLDQHDNIFALGDIACCPPADATLPGTAQLALQEANLAADNIKAVLSGRELQTKHFEELGEALSLGTERGAVLLAGGQAFGGALARQARFALYTSRLPTWHHRLRVGASWFFEGTAPRPLLPLGLER
ncbi:MAG TPA: NAD(P)/FAD-dependent oxidoreductase [Pyrinomonadaceae bacterium]|nr:NAD(P)/FAD-dependent oxidoreductase [Pyrinomonadaceae bacterium]